MKRVGQCEVRKLLLAFSPYRGQGQPRVSRFPAEVVRDMIKDPDGVYVDGTFGRGGHTKLLLGALSKKGRLIAFDLDPEAVRSELCYHH